MRKRQYFKVTHHLVNGGFHVYAFKVGQWADIFRMTKDPQTESVTIQRIQITETEYEQKFGD